MIVQLNNIARGHPNRSIRALGTIKALVFHYTANDDPEMDALNTAKWFGRRYMKTSNGQILEVDGKPWKFGSAHFIFDKDCGYECIPENEEAYHVGDQHKPDGFRGQQFIAESLFKHQQNLQTLGIEICNNNAFILPGSDPAWEQACNNAIDWAKGWVIWNSRKVNVEWSLDPQGYHGELEEEEILILRHYDLTGKICPKPFVDNPLKWKEFVNKILN